MNPIYVCCQIPAQIISEPPPCFHVDSNWGLWSISLVLVDPGPHTQDLWALVKRPLTHLLSGVRGSPQPSQLKFSSLNMILAQMVCLLMWYLMNSPSVFRCSSFSAGFLFNFMYSTLSWLLKKHFDGPPWWHCFLLMTCVSGLSIKLYELHSSCLWDEAILVFSLGHTLHLLQGHVVLLPLIYQFLMAPWGSGNPWFL